MTLDPRAVARALGGSVSGRNVVAPAGHSRADRSLSIRIEPTAPDGLIFHSFAGGSPLECREYLRSALGLGPREPRRRRNHAQLKTETEEERAARLKAEQERPARQRAQSSALVVYPFEEWCVLRGLSVPTGRRLVAAGRVKLTYLSARRVGVRSDHDAEYLDSCTRDGA